MVYDAPAKQSGTEDIYLKYKNAFEFPLTSSGAKICKTAQKYCEKDNVNNYFTNLPVYRLTGK